MRISLPRPLRAPWRGRFVFALSATVLLATCGGEVGDGSDVENEEPREVLRFTAAGDGPNAPLAFGEAQAVGDGSDSGSGEEEAGEVQVSSGCPAGQMQRCEGMSGENLVCTCVPISATQNDVWQAPPPPQESVPYEYEPYRGEVVSYEDESSHHEEHVPPPPPGNCSGCVGSHGSCAAACRALVPGSPGGVCGNPGSTDSSRCCACDAPPPSCASCLGSHPNCTAACRGIGAANGVCAHPGSTNPGRCCACSG